MKLLSEDRKLRIATREINSFLLHPVTLRRIRCCAQSLVELPLHFYIHCVYEQIGEHVQHLAQVAEAGGVLFRLEFEYISIIYRRVDACHVAEARSPSGCTGLS